MTKIRAAIIVYVTTHLVVTTVSAPTSGGVDIVTKSHIALTTHVAIKARATTQMTAMCVCAMKDG